MGEGERRKIKRWLVARFCTYHRDCTYEFLVSCLHTAEPKSMILTIRFEAETRQTFSGLMSQWTTAQVGSERSNESHTREGMRGNESRMREREGEKKGGVLLIVWGDR